MLAFFWLSNSISRKLRHDVMTPCFGILHDHPRLSLLAKDFRIIGSNNPAETSEAARAASRPSARIF